MQDRQEAAIDLEFQGILLLQQVHELRRREIEGQARKAGLGCKRGELVVDGNRRQRIEHLGSLGRRQRDGDARIGDARRLGLRDDQLIDELFDLRDDGRDEVDATCGRGRRIAVFADGGGIVDAPRDAIAQGDIGGLVRQIGLCRRDAVRAVADGEDAAAKLA